jgi:hypothetical protein
MLDAAISTLGSQEPDEAAATPFIQAHTHPVNANVQFCGLSLWMLLTLSTGTLMDHRVMLRCHISSSARPGCLDGAQLQSNCIAAKLINLSFYKS